MSFRFRKTLRIAPGVRLNLSKGGISNACIHFRRLVRRLCRRGHLDILPGRHGVFKGCG